MPFRTNLLFTTALSTAGAFWVVSPGHTADLNQLPASGSLYEPISYTDPAVSGVNYKFQGFAGAAYGDGIGGVIGSLSVPFGQRWGVQVDGLVGSWGGDALYGLASHVFWRDPSTHLFGLYASWTHSDRSIDLDAFHIAAEAEWYRGNWTVAGLGGYEFGEITDRFYSRLTLGYYSSPNHLLEIGHSYAGGDNHLLLGAEWLTGHQVGGARTSLFADASISQDDTAAWAGLKLYFGPSQSLIDKHRRDDPDAIVNLAAIEDEAQKMASMASSGIFDC